MDGRGAATAERLAELQAELASIMETLDDLQKGVAFHLPQARPGVIKLTVGDHSVTIHPYGHIEFEGSVDAAARTFWSVVRRLVPQMGNLPLTGYTTEELRAELGARGDVIG